MQSNKQTSTPFDGCPLPENSRRQLAVSDSHRTPIIGVDSDCRAVRYIDNRIEATSFEKKTRDILAENIPSVEAWISENADEIRHWVWTHPRFSWILEHDHSNTSGREELFGQLREGLDFATIPSEWKYLGCRGYHQEKGICWCLYTTGESPDRTVLVAVTLDEKPYTVASIDDFPNAMAAPKTVPNWCSHQPESYDTIAFEAFYFQGIRDCHVAEVEYRHASVVMHFESIPDHWIDYFDSKEIENLDSIEVMAYPSETP